MSTILTVTYGEGDIVHQLYGIKLSALRNNDIPALWRLTEPLMELVLQSLRFEAGQWPADYFTNSHILGVPVDLVGALPHLLCDDYVIYPYSANHNPLTMH